MDATHIFKICCSIHKHIFLTNVAPFRQIYCQELNVSYIALFYSTEEQILLQERNNQTKIFLLFDLLSAIFEV